MSVPEIWKHCLSRLEQELTDYDFSTWIMPLDAQSSDAGLVLLAPNVYCKERVEKQFLEQMIRPFCSPLTVSLSLHSAHQPASPIDNPPATAYEQEPVQGGNSAPATVSTTGPGRLNRTFNFDNHVEGKSNSFARASAMQVGSNPGRGYNPLFIYGGVGLGKTHLMQAAGDMMLRDNPRARVAYVHSEHFVSDMVNAIRTNNMQRFKENYRSLDALLIDDIQFFSGKTSSQEEFFHTFNELTRRNSQIIITSDSYHKDIEGLEDRIISRLGSGLQVAIEPPELETRVAILNNKALSLDADLPRDVAFFIAENVRDNVRSLEGALQSIVAMARFVNQPISIDIARDALRHQIRSVERQTNPENIISEVCDYYNIRKSDILSKSRKRDIAVPRQTAMALCRELTTKSLPEIGEIFGRDHTTVMNACRRIAEKRETEDKVSNDWDALVRRLGG